jgi:acyl carrier protein
MLEGYSNKIADATEFQERFGIAVSQTDAEAIERANDAVGRLREIFSGLGNILAARVAPVIARVAEVLISMSGMLARRLNPAMSEYDKATRDASDAQKALNEAMGIFHKTAAPESAKRALGLAQAYLLQAQNAVNAAKAERELAAAEQERRLAQAPGYLQRAFEEGNLQIPELEAATARLEEASKRLSDAQVQLQRRVREITASENMVYIGGPTEDEPPAVPSIGGGSSVRDMMAERLEALREGLMTENEVVSTWYVDSLQTLNDALAARQLTEEEYMELRERLEKEHQSRLNAIRAAGEHTGLETTKSVLGSMLQAVQAGGDKLINAQKAVSAAIAAINVYEGITKALTLEWPQNFIVAAQVAAQGFAAVSRIQSMGRGGSTAAVTGGAATSAPALPRQNIVIDLVGDTFSRMSVQEVFNQINQGLRQGYQIEGILAR